MVNIPKFDEFIIESSVSKLLESFSSEDAILEYTDRDIKRIKDLFKRAKGVEPKVIQLANAMAKSIKDPEKAYARGEAAEFALGKKGERTPNMIADIFYNKATELGMDVGTEKAAIPPKENPDPIFRNGINGAIYLPTWSAIAVFDHEILGQISDGAWENTRPTNHWKFWRSLEIKHGQPEVKHKFSARPLKTSYNLGGLVKDLGKRMVNFGRMGKAVGTNFSQEIGYGLEYMPDTLEAFEEGSRNNWKGKYFGEYFNKIPSDWVKKYYKTNYTEKDLRADLKQIKIAMNNLTSV